jgi:DeoR/GlpR family transcriptional regulator of sugar metabolism
VLLRRRGWAHGTLSANAAQAITFAAALNSVMVRRAREKIVVVDHSKLGVLATYGFCPTRDVNCLITDTGATDEMVAGFVGQGIDVRRV